MWGKILPFLSSLDSLIQTISRESLSDRAKIVSKPFRVFNVKVVPKNSLASKVFELSIKKHFPFPLVTFVQVLSHPYRLKGFIVIKRSYINHFKSSLAIVLGDNVCLDFITFTVPKEVKKEIVHLFYAEIHLSTKVRRRFDNIVNAQTARLSSSCHLVFDA